MGLDFLNYFFHFLHIVVILLNTFGWLYKPTWYLQIVVLMVTTLSWIVCGAFYGFGYCFLTDWHWQVKRAAGESDLPHSYTKLLYDQIFQTDVSTVFIDQLTAGVMILGLIGCLCRGLWEYR